MTTVDKPSHIRFTLKTFTETEIEQLLETGGNFRKLRPSHRDAILDDMRTDRWNSGTGQPLIFDAKEKMLDGQHRLAAALIYQRETGKRVWFWCAIGAEPKIEYNIDTGMNRVLKDYLKREGVQYLSYVAAIAGGEARSKMMPKDALNTLYHIASSAARYRPEGGKDCLPRKVPLALAIDVWKRNRSKMAEWGAMASRVVSASLPRPGLMASLGYQFSKTHDMEAKLFFEYLIEGSGLKANDPVYVLRERLLADRAAKAKMSGEHLSALVIKAWVAWNEGRVITNLRYSASGPRGETFPSHRFKKPEELATAST